MKLWSLYNKEEKLRIDDLTVQQVKVILLSISSRRMEEWYACPSGKMAWMPLAEVKDFKQDVAEIHVPMKKAAGAEHSPALAPSRPLRDVTYVDSKSANLTIDFSSIKERRSARRYTRRLHFHCVIQGQSFDCETVDVSMTGLSLTDELPKWIPKIFKAELTLHHQSATIMCERVSNKKLKISGTDNWDLLRRWIVNF